MYKPESVPENEMHEIDRDLKIQTDHFNSIRRQYVVLFNEKKRSCRLVNVVVSLSFVFTQTKESEKFDKYQDLAGEQKRLWNIVTVIVVDAFGPVPKKKDWRKKKSEEESRPSRLQNC